MSTRKVSLLRMKYIGHGGKVDKGMVIKGMSIEEVEGVRRLRYRSEEDCPGQVCSQEWCQEESGSWNQEEQQ